jgi:hypothetical protein
MMKNIQQKNNEFSDEAGIRRNNRAVIEDYMSRKGETRKTRYLLFTQNGSAGLWTSDTGHPIESSGHQQLKAHGEWSLKMFPDWEWINVTIYDTQDPNHFWVECDGEGQILYPNYPPGQYKNHFIHSFKFENGLIKQNREFMNPFQQLRALGIEVPKINRGSIPS